MCFREWKTVATAGVVSAPSRSGNALGWGVGVTRACGEALRRL